MHWSNVVRKWKRVRVETGDKMWGKGGAEEEEAKRNERNKGAGGN